MQPMSKPRPALSLNWMCDFAAYSCFTDPNGDLWIMPAQNYASELFRGNLNITTDTPGARRTNDAWAEAIATRGLRPMPVAVTLSHPPTEEEMTVMSQFMNDHGRVSILDDKGVTTITKPVALSPEEVDELATWMDEDEPSLTAQEVEETLLTADDFRETLDALRQSNQEAVPTLIPSARKRARKE